MLYLLCYRGGSKSTVTLGQFSSFFKSTDRYLICFQIACSFRNGITFNKFIVLYFLIFRFFKKILLIWKFIFVNYNKDFLNFNNSFGFIFSFAVSTIYQELVETWNMKIDQKMALKYPDKHGQVS